MVRTLAVFVIVLSVLSGCSGGGVATPVITPETASQEATEDASSTSTEMPSLEATPIEAETEQMISSDQWVGKWVQDGSNERDSSVITITSADQLSLTFTLSAFHVIGDFDTANLGDIDEGIAQIEGNTAVFTDNEYSDFRLEMELNEGKLSVKTDGIGYFGMNVYVDGLYTKVEGDLVFVNDTLYQSKGSLCRSDELQYFGFTVQGNGKIMSLCGNPNADYLTYRYGKQDSIEYTYPDDRDGWNSFEYAFYLRGGGEDNEGQDLNELTFRNADYEYVIYDDYVASEPEPQIGIRVTNLKTKKLTDIQGVPSTRIGSLASLRDTAVQEVPFS